MQPHQFEIEWLDGNGGPGVRSWPSQQGRTSRGQWCTRVRRRQRTSLGKPTADDDAVLAAIAEALASAEALLLAGFETFRGQESGAVSGTQFRNQGEHGHHEHIRLS